MSHTTAYADAVVDLLGMLAHGELLAFDRMAGEARLAPDLTRRGVFCEMAGAEIANYRRIVDRVRAMGADPELAMAPFHAALVGYHDQTVPSDWLEALTKAYVGDGVATDFFREVATLLDDDDRRFVLDVLHESRAADFVTAEVRSAIAADAGVANRLSMWARRLLGEGITQAQRVAGDRPVVTQLILERIGAGGEENPIAALFGRLTTRHAERMSTLGLNN